MDSWEMFNETSLPCKKAVYSELHLENITDKDYKHAQKLFEEFNLKNIRDCHNFYVQSDALLLADVLDNFKNKCIEIYELDPSHFLFFCTRISMISLFEKYGNKIKVINKYFYVGDGWKKNQKGSMSCYA